MRMLEGLLERETRKEMHEAYTAQMLYYLNQAAYRGEFKHASWLGMVKPEEKDTRTGQEVVDDLIETIKKRRERRRKEG